MTISYCTVRYMPRLMSIFQIHGLSKMRLASQQSLLCHVMRLHRRLSSNQCDATLRLPLCLRLCSPEAKRALRGVACQDLVTTPIQPRRAVGHDHRPHHCPSLQSLFGATPQFCESVTPSPSPSPRLRSRGSSYSVCGDRIPTYACARLIPV